jgi:putative protein-disulfide isomerase
LDVKLFTQDLNKKQTQHQLLDDITLAKKIGISSFPSLALKTQNEIKPIAIDYNDAEFILKQIIT